MHDFTTVFDVAQSGYKAWFFPAFGLILVVFSAIPALVARQLKGAVKLKSKRFATVFFIFAAAWVVLAFYTTHSEYVRMRDALKTGDYTTVEGVVTHFVPMPRTGHALEHFCVQDACFSYSDYVVTNGFNTTESHGGPVHAGEYVRVSYIEESGHRNAIIKLAIRQ